MSFFKEPALDIRNLLAVDAHGKGKIQILDCQKLMRSPRMYATMMLWLISQLFELLPEVGDLDQPKMVFFFDEAPKGLLEKVEQLVKLIPSKGDGIYFVTQTSSDIPDGILAQLGNKIQHALHAYTSNGQKTVKASANALRKNDDFDTYEVLQTLGIGEALVSVLDEHGVPTVVERCQTASSNEKRFA